MNQFEQFETSNLDAPFRLFSGETPPNTKGPDPSIYLAKKYESFAEIFDFSVSEDLIKYNKRIQEVADKHLYISCEERHWSDRSDNYKVFIRFLRPFYRLSDKPNVTEVIKSKTRTIK